MSFEAQVEANPLTPEQDAELRSLAIARAPEALAALESAESEEALFYALPNAASAAFQLGRFVDAQEFAERALALASSYEKNWNFGNAIHAGHTVLGLLALERGELEIAVSELSKAGATPGSPQLDSFGPSMQLAKALLQRGKFDAVLFYIQQCRKFWKMGTVWLDLWEQKVRAGGMPNCVMHAYR